MGLDIHIEDHSGEVLERIKAAAQQAMESCGLTAEGYAKLACPVGQPYGGTLRESITHEVTEEDGKYTCYIGTNTEYAAYVELGTGIYYPGGRDTPWVYKDEKTGEWHMTHGQRAQAYLKPAVADYTDTYQTLIENSFRNG